MANSTSAPLSAFYLFDKKELVIDFEDAKRAIAYQNKNREGRILTEEPTKVYLPLSNGMQYIRYSSRYGMKVGFSQETEAEQWLQKFKILGVKSSDRKTVNVKLHWKPDELDKALDVSDSERPPQTPNGESQLDSATPAPTRPKPPSSSAGASDTTIKRNGRTEWQVRESSKEPRRRTSASPGPRERAEPSTTTDKPDKKKQASNPGNRDVSGTVPQKPKAKASKSGLRST
jgi:hypothetical protein